MDEEPPLSLETLRDSQQQINEGEGRELGLPLALGGGGGLKPGPNEVSSSAEQQQDRGGQEMDNPLLDGQRTQSNYKEEEEERRETEMKAEANEEVERAEVNEQQQLPEEKGEPERHEKQPSPEPNCAICLGKMENKSFTDSCFHQFCFTCLLEWSKVKAECPLCKQAFKSIVHNVRSIEDYDQYHLQHTASHGDYGSWDGNEGGRRFRYRSTLTAERRREMALGRLLLGHHNYSFRSSTTNQSSSSSSTSPSSSSRPFAYTTSEFRRYIYENNLWARASCRASRYREAAPNFYTSNPAVTHRLVPWLNRELNALRYGHQVAFLLELIMSLVHRFHIRSPEFLEHIRPYFLGNASHFVHEFFHFARSPHDMVEYDRMVTYAPRGISSSSVDGTSSSSSDNEVVVVYTGEGSSRTSSRSTPVLTRARNFLRLVSASTPMWSFSSRDFVESSDTDLPFGRPAPTSSYMATQLRRSVSPIAGTSGASLARSNTSVKQEVTLDDDDDEDDEDCMIITVQKRPLQNSPKEVIELSDDDDDIVIAEEVVLPSTSTSVVEYEPSTRSSPTPLPPTPPHPTRRRMSRSSDSGSRHRSRSRSRSSTESDWKPSSERRSKSKHDTKSHKKHHKKHRSSKKHRSRSTSRHRHKRSHHRHRSSSSERNEDRGGREERQKKHKRTRNESERIDSN